jgi:hypothetical protein
VPGQIALGFMVSNLRFVLIRRSVDVLTNRYDGARVGPSPTVNRQCPAVTTTYPPQLKNEGVMKRALLVSVVAILASYSASYEQMDAAESPAHRRLLSTSSIGYGAATRINASGQVLVVTGQAAPIDVADRTFLWSPDSGLFELRFGSEHVIARGAALSDSGYIAGEMLSPRGLREAFIWSSSAGMKLVSADPVIENSSATAVNDAGEVVGGRTAGTWSYRWSPATGWLHGNPLDATAPKYCIKSAVGISASGRVGGRLQSVRNAPVPRIRARRVHAYLLRRDSIAIDLGTLEVTGARRSPSTIADTWLAGFRFDRRVTRLLMVGVLGHGQSRDARR